MQHLQKDQFTGSLIPVTKSASFAPLIGHAGALATLGALDFKDVRFQSGYIISKPPLSPSLAWHQDGWYWNDADAGYSERPAQLFAMYYLTNTSRQNGCLRVIPGTHRRSHPLHAQLGTAHSDAVRSKAEWEESPEHSDVAGAVDVAVRAGDMVIGDARLLHGAHRNQSPERRTVLTLWYIPHFGTWSDAFRDGVVKLHVSKAAEVYEWAGAAARLVEALLPETDAQPLASRRAASAESPSGGDEFDHNLAFMVRQPGWDGLDERSASVWRSLASSGPHDEL
jgi:hypothetical protein